MFDSNNLLQALDTLGNTKWRVNRRILSVVENIWAAGGNIAGLVNREDVSALSLSRKIESYSPSATFNF